MWNYNVLLLLAETVCLQKKT